MPYLYKENMLKEFEEAFVLIFTGDAELWKILSVTMRMSFFSTLFSVILGFPLGVLLGTVRFRLQKTLSHITGTLMSLPPVVAGLLVFLLLSRSGPFGSFRLLYTIRAMVIAQVILITPLVASMSAAILERQAMPVLETCKGLGMSPLKSRGVLLWECRTQLISVIMAAFGRSIAEVGAVQLVGGNVQYKTRVMTTAIVLETNMGRFSLALALGIILLVLAFLVNVLARQLERKTHHAV